MKKTFLWILFAVALTYLVRELLYIGVRKNRIGEYDKLNTIFLKHNNYNCLVIGSSRAESHFNPRIIDSITHLDSYNIGLEGATMPFILGGLEAYLVNSKAPEYVMLNIDFHAFKDNNDTIHRFPRYFPYLSNKKFYHKLKERDHRFLFFKWIPLYSLPYFNEQYLNASLRGYFGIENEFDQSFIQGYAPVPPGLTIDVDTFKYSKFYSNPQEIIFQSLDSIINVCKKNNSKLIFVVSPMYYKGFEAVTNRNELLQIFKNIAEKYNLGYMDYTSSDFCNDKTLFADPYHSNKKGSILFSEKFANDLRQYINNLSVN